LIASAVNCPCFRAFRLPRGAPGDNPPCILQRPFGIAGDRQGLPLRVLAPHRGASCIGKRMGLISTFSLTPSSLSRMADVANNGLPALVNVHMLNDDALLA